MRSITILTIFLLLFAVGCGGGSKTVRSSSSDKPFSCADGDFEYKKGECCEDSNDNQVCDRDDDVKEDVAMIAEAVEPEESPPDLTKSWCVESQKQIGGETVIYSNPGKKTFKDITFSACLRTAKDKSGRIASQRWYSEDENYVVEEKFQFGVFVSRDVYWPDKDGYYCHELYDRNDHQIEHICQ